VDEYIFAALTWNETKTFGSIKPFDCSFFHGTYPFIKIVKPADRRQGVRRTLLKNTFTGLIRPKEVGNIFMEVFKPKDWMEPPTDDSKQDLLYRKGLPREP
jgi:hypothetical protein